MGVSSNMKHTQEPWATEYREDKAGMFHQDIFDAEGKTIAILSWYRVKIDEKTTTTNREENARRIVACVNALAGVATERLEKAVSCGSGFWGNTIKESDAALLKMKKQRDELLEALKNILDIGNTFDCKDKECSHIDCEVTRYAKNVINRVENA